MRSLLLLSLLAAAQVAATTVYRTVDPEGNVHYSDRPEGADTEELTIRIQRAGVPTPPASAPEASREADAGGAQQPAEPAGPTPGQLAQEAERQAQQREENCATARDRAQRFAISHRIYRSLPDGEREYLSSEEIDEARARADADVKAWCD
jgi:hypothetical protein